MSENIPIAAVAEAVSASTGVSLIDMRADRRSPIQVEARWTAMLLARELTRLSTCAIARWFGDRDHSTVISASRMLTERMATDFPLFLRVEAVRSTLLELHRRKLLRDLESVDPLQVAARVLRDPVRAPSLVSGREIRAMAERIIELEAQAHDDDDEDDFTETQTEGAIHG